MHTNRRTDSNLNPVVLGHASMVLYAPGTLDAIEREHGVRVTREWRRRAGRARVWSRGELKRQARERAKGGRL